jgi:hypothetical protein
MYHSGRADGLVTRRQVSDRHADMVAIVSRIVPHSKPLKGFRKLSQFVEMPGFRMWTALLGETVNMSVNFIFVGCILLRYLHILYKHII